jgi:hypothetical protein
MAMRIIFCLVLLAASAFAQANALSTFERMKHLEGTWLADWPGKAETVKADVLVRFDLIAKGTVLRETQGAGTPGEMATHYFVDGDAIVAAHYCVKGNQPTMRSEKITNGGVWFADPKLTGKPNVAYMKLIRFEFYDSDHATYEWAQYTPDGKKQVSWTMSLTRKPRA